MSEFELKTKPIITYGGKPSHSEPATIRPGTALRGAPQDWLIYLGSHYAYRIVDLLSIEEHSLAMEKEGTRGKVGGKERPPCGTIPQRVCVNAGYRDDDQTWCENARELIIEALRSILSGDYAK